MVERGRRVARYGHDVQLGGVGLFVQIRLGAVNRFVAAACFGAAGLAAFLAAVVAGGRGVGHRLDGDGRSGAARCFGDDGGGGGAARLFFGHAGRRYRCLPH